MPPVFLKYQILVFPLYLKDVPETRILFWDVSADPVHPSPPNRVQPKKKTHRLPFTSRFTRANPTAWGFLRLEVSDP